MSVRLEIYGIRHHGPGSCRSLLKALEWQEPDCILVECPSDCQDALEQIGAKALKPPLAILLYNIQNMRQAIYLPFAEFSPEWQAAKYAKEKSIPVEAIDLPYSTVFGMGKEEDDYESIPQTKLERQISRDPLGYVANLAGYESGESWWDATFEHNYGGKETFEWIEHLMTELRLTIPSASEYSNDAREAYMCKQIQAAHEQGFQNIAVVCGAWHVPALRSCTDISGGKKKKSSPIKSFKTQAIWIPWTYERLALHSGYAAGVISPAWYELLFQEPEFLAAHWLSKAARLLRKQKWDASAAQVLDASKLADMLAIIRERPKVGLEELQEAALTVLCEGNPARYSSIEESLIIGNKAGKIPSNTTKLPLQNDFEQKVKTARLSKSYQSAARESKELDLRVTSNQVASSLLHLLNLLDIPWGRLLSPAKGRLGNFKETWSLKWKPDYIIQMIQQAMFGTTLKEAAGKFVLHKMKSIKSVSELANLLDQLLSAELPEIIPQVLQRLDDLIADSHDVNSLLHTWITLMDIRSFGSVRDIDEAWIDQVLEHLFPRVCFMLPMQIRQLDNEAQMTLAFTMERAQSVITKTKKESFQSLWKTALEGVLLLGLDAPYLQGKASRLLTEMKMMSEESLQRLFLLIFSQQAETQFALSWLAGFLAHNPGQIILRPNLWEPIASWVAGMEWEKFQSILPILRKNFAELEVNVRRRIWNKLTLLNEKPLEDLILQVDSDLMNRLKKSWKDLLTLN